MDIDGSVAPGGSREQGILAHAMRAISAAVLGPVRKSDDGVADSDRPRASIDLRGRQQQVGCVHAREHRQAFDPSAETELPKAQPMLVTEGGQVPVPMARCQPSEEARTSLVRLRTDT
ncbi:hypothetical protein MPEAHAMD_3569 [Methylobacterium frigidaeris]|uniref:Uncharacterized protein n=1 Tax=Methylobacterium frigidaeris TaxID=2038277 RepID=A0AA37M638_9HYPH|nr:MULTISPECIES: hypothetical protein [Methylobacterium]GJD63401.1 hypothetical protein MPEAHAMD_3569 [Methylobacterium frigidaeris]